MKRLLCAWERFWFQPTSPSPVCLFRIFFGLLSMLNALSWYPDLLLWYSRQGVLEEATAYEAHGPILSLFNWIPASDTAIIGILAVYALASLTLTLGFFSRTSAFIAWLAIVSLNQRNPYIFHHAGTLLRLYGFLLIWAPSGAMYSLDQKLRPEPNPQREPWATRLMQLTLVAVYWKASCGKLAGSAWLDGTAVYYATHQLDNIRHAVPSWLDRAWIYQGLTWYTLAVELSLWTLIWLRRTRYPVLLAGTLLHLGIQWFLELDLLEWAAIIGYLVFLFPEDVEGWLRLPAKKQP